jgi:hypothetical protein
MDRPPPIRHRDVSALGHSSHHRERRPEWIMLDARNPADSVQNCAAA